jgi:multidrug efflux pump subunit AcrB
MNLPRFAVRRPPVVLVVTLIVMAFGVYNFATMPRREDPEILIRDCTVITQWPGASAHKVEELVTDPLEKAIAEIPEIDEYTSTSRAGLSILRVTLEDSVEAPDQSWDEVRAKVERVVPRLPEGCRRPFVNSDVGDVFQICLALYQEPAVGGRPYPPRRLEQFAEMVEDEVKLIEAVAKVEFWGVQEERIYLYVDSADWARLGLDAAALRNRFEARNIVAPGGQLETEESRYAVLPTGEFETVRQMEDLVVDRLGGRVPVRLGDLPFRLERGYVDPPETLARITTPAAPAAPCVVVGIAMKSNRNITVLSGEVDRTLAKLRATVLPPDMRLERVNDLPRQVRTRVHDFTINLAQGVVIVLGVALLMMGLRPALIMAAAVPLSMVAAFAVVRLFGVQLEQFSIASLIIALGMVVDNAIVVSDNVVRLRREGKSRREAAVAGAQGLAVPILTSTLTTICAFLPLLGLPGNNGEYVRSLPIVVASTLGASYFVAMLVTPLLCMYVVKAPRAGATAPAGGGTAGRRPVYDRVLHWCLDHKLVVLGGAVGVFLGAIALLPLIGSQFFPDGQRDQFFIDVWMPEGSSIAATDRVCREVEAVLRETSAGADGADRLASAVSFVGDGGPRIMLTKSTEETFPYYGSILVNTTDARRTDAYAEAVRARVADIPGARIMVQSYRFGPPLVNQVELRLGGDDAERLRAAGEEIVGILRKTSGAVGPRSNWGASGHQVRVDIDADAANLAGATNADVAVAMNALLSGYELTVFREGDHRVPVVLRTTRERRSLDDLTGLHVSGAAGKVPLAALAVIEPTWEPSVVARRNGVRTVTVGARVVPGVLPNAVTRRALPAVRDVVDALPPGYALEVGGEQEETSESQALMARAMAIAVALILVVLVAQYNSLAKPLVIIFTVPLAMIGVLVGLWVTGWAMGFMVMLGIVSLAGVVINNAIVLIDFIEGLAAGGTPLREAMAQAGRLRMRPILLTSLTTIGGLLPLALFGGPLWEGMAWGMIFGLGFSTALTLLVVPTLYALFVERFGMRVAALPEE